jgi:Protein of unknown function (DUF2752)
MVRGPMIVVASLCPPRRSHGEDGWRRLSDTATERRGYNLNLNPVANDNYPASSPDSRSQGVIRLAFVIGATATLFVLRSVDPVAAGSWLPFHTSCGAITGLPCIFCGMTRALHALLNGDLARAVYFNWLAVPFLGAVVFLIACCMLEMAGQRVDMEWNIIVPITKRKLTIIGSGLFLLWAVHVYLAVSQHKDELLNPDGPLYAFFVR